MTLPRAIASSLLSLVLVAGPNASAGYAVDASFPTDAVHVSTLDTREIQALCNPISARLQQVRPEDTKRILCHQLAVASQTNVQDCNQVVEECMASQLASLEERSFLSCNTFTQISHRCDASARELEQCFTELADNLVNLSRTVSCQTPLEVIAGLMKPASCARIETTCG